MKTTRYFEERVLRRGPLDIDRASARLDPATLETEALLSTPRTA